MRPNFDSKVASESNIEDYRKKTEMFTSINAQGFESILMKD